MEFMWFMGFSCNIGFLPQRFYAKFVNMHGCLSHISGNLSRVHPATCLTTAGINSILNRIKIVNKIDG